MHPSVSHIFDCTVIDCLRKRLWSASVSASAFLWCRRNCRHHSIRCKYLHVQFFSANNFSNIKNKLVPNYSVWCRLYHRIENVKYILFFGADDSVCNIWTLMRITSVSGAIIDCIVPVNWSHEFNQGMFSTLYLISKRQQRKI